MHYVWRTLRVIFSIYKLTLDVVVKAIYHQIRWNNMYLSRKL